jgi:endoglucanase
VTARKVIAAGLLLAAALALALAGTGRWPWGRALAKRALGLPAWLRRAAELEPPPFAHLAASQVGYTPQMAKLFTSPRPFTTFRIVREDGALVLSGGGPAREIPTDLLGPVERVWEGDFTALRRPGRYRIVADNGLASHPFRVADGVLDPVVRAVQRAFYFQRAFTAIDSVHAEGPWVHGSDAALAPPGVGGGWHDAGDFSVYSASLNSALFWLLEAYSDFRPTADDTNIPESGNGIPDLLDEARWGLAWLLSVQAPSGGFANTTCQERYGAYGTNRPEAAAPYRAGEVGALATARAVGTLAYAAAVFDPIDPAYARRCLEAARHGQAYLDAHPRDEDDGPTCPAFRQDGDRQAGRDVRGYAAAGMLLATGEERFRRDFEERAGELTNDPSAYRFNVYAALLYLRAPAGAPGRRAAVRQALRASAARAREDGQAHPFGWAGRYFWGSIAAGFQRAALSAKVCLDSPEQGRADCAQALASVHYALGRNALDFCYVSGLPGVEHGREHAFHQWLAALQATPYAFPGLIAGGPVAAPVASDTSFPAARPLPIWGYRGDPARRRDGTTPLDARYTDNDSWSTNELDVDWQGVGLYALYFARWWATWASHG